MLTSPDMNLGRTSRVARALMGILLFLGCTSVWVRADEPDDVWDFSIADSIDEAEPIAVGEGMGFEYALNLPAMSTPKPKSKPTPKDKLSGKDPETKAAQTTASAKKPDDSKLWKLNDERLMALEERVADLSATPKPIFPQVRLSGAMQADAGFFSMDQDALGRFGRIQDGADLRRVRLAGSGNVTESTPFFIQADFGFFGRPTLTDVWVEQGEIPYIGNVRLGQWKQPFSLEVVSSYRYTMMMERSLLFQAFTPFRHPGVGLRNYSEQWNTTWAASVFRSGQDQFGGSISTKGGWGTAERITWLPCWNDDKDPASYLHLGLGHFFNAPPFDRVVFRTIPEFYVGVNAPGVVGTSGQPAPGAFDGTPFFISTGVLDVNAYNVIGTEVLMVNGPFTLQSETMINFVSPVTGADAVLYGSYAEVGYFLTGEHRPYDRKLGAVERVIPNQNLQSGKHDRSRGMGAWEVTGRVSRLVLNDEAIRGGSMTSYTAGLNWYWNSFTKTVFNYIYAMPDDPRLGSSASNIFACRAQVDF